MVFLNLQGRLGDLGFARASYHQGRKPKQESALIFIAIALLHMILIVVALNIKSKQREISVMPAFKMIYLSQEKPPAKTELNIPVIEPVSIRASMVLPDVIFEERPALDLRIDTSSSSYVLPNPNDSKYRDVFDPKMRQKLIDAEILNRARIKGQTIDWKESDGRDFAAKGDGRCFVSMRQVDSRDRGKNLGGTGCGKTDSESMMDRVNDDLEARKHPLKAQ